MNKLKENESEIFELPDKVIKVIIDGDEYIVEGNSLKRYDEEYKMWVILNFLDESQHSVAEEIREMMIKEYTKVLQSQL
jgi:hypothetical protein